jgi:hypothetical protein
VGGDDEADDRAPDEEAQVGERPGAGGGRGGRRGGAVGGLARCGRGVARESVFVVRVVSGMPLRVPRTDGDIRD